MSLQHVTVELPRGGMAAEREFWRLLGFERVEPPRPLDERSAWVQRNGTQIHFLFTEQPVTRGRATSPWWPRTVPRRSRA